jgi:hypothetical protein
MLSDLEIPLLWTLSRSLDQVEEGSSMILISSFEGIHTSIVKIYLCNTDPGYNGLSGCY